MFTHDVIKQKYSVEGYLPDYPPHLISDKEMFQAFIPLQYFSRDDDGDVVFGLSEWDSFVSDSVPSYFKDNYPSLGNVLMKYYKGIISDICYHIYNYLDDNTYEVPSWVYSYMLGAVIGPASDKLDIHDLLVMMGCDNKDDDYGEKEASRCLQIALEYENSANVTKEQHRPVTIFGELYIVKYLRLKGLSR